MAAALAASLEAGAPRLPGRGAGSARAAELLQQEAHLAARLFAAAGRRPPRGLRQAAASSSEEAARFSVPVSRMGDYLEVGARHRSMCAPLCSTACSLSCLPLALTGWSGLADGGTECAAAGPGAGRRRARTAQPQRLWQPIPARQARSVWRARRPWCGSHHGQIAGLPVCMKRGVCAWRMGSISRSSRLRARSGRGCGRGARAGPGLCGRQPGPAAAAHARARLAQPLTRRPACAARWLARRAARAHPGPAGAPCCARRG